MRNEPNLRLDKHRRPHPHLGDSPPGASYGYFEMGKLRLVSSGSAHAKSQGWEHVSVSRIDGKMPSWGEMKKVKELFWRDDECVVQFHPPKSSYVNLKQTCLHLWKSDVDFPMPPVEQV